MQRKKIMTVLSPSTNVEMAAKICDRLPVRLDPAESVEDIFHLLNDPSYRTDFVCIGIDALTDKKYGLDMYAILGTIETLLKVNCYLDDGGEMQRRCTKVQVLIDEQTDSCLIKEIMSVPIVSGIGWITKTPDDLEHCIEHLEKMLSGGDGLHHKVQEILRPKKNYRVEGDIVLTSRQSQVLHLLQDRGSSNKVIARTLHISESTVKLHIGAILKKYGVKNRTQLALFSQNITKQ